MPYLTGNSLTFSIFKFINLILVMRTFTTYLTFLLLALPFFTVGQTHIWTGNGGNNNWFNPSNWNVNTVPDATGDVLLPTGSLVEITSNAASVDFLTIEPNATLEVNNSLSITTGVEIVEEGHFLYTLGTLSGDAVITNYGTFEITGIPAKLISQLTINNESLLLISEAGMINLRDDMSFNNAENAIITISGQGGAWSSDSTGATFNNFGLFLKPDIGEFGVFYLMLTNNNHGTIYVGKSQHLLILTPQNSLNNFETGILSGEGSFDITSPFTNNGKIVPDGDQAVELQFLNTFVLSPESVIEIDIFGQNLEDYDRIVVFGNPFIEGIIDLTLHYEALIDDEFTIITTTQGITGCDLPPSIFATYQNFIYEFEVNCTSNNVVLKVTDKVLNVDEYDPLNILATPNPTTGTFEILFGTFVSEIDLIVSNIFGQIISTHTAHNTDMYQITIDGATGIYLINAKTANSTGTFKVVKK